MLNDRERKVRVRFPNIEENRKREATQEHAGAESNTKRTGAKPAENVNMQAVADDVEVPTHPLVLDDGKTHINIDAFAQTDLGRMLVHQFPAKFEHPEFGRFRSVEGFWGYVRDRNRDDRWRYVSGMAAKRETRNQGEVWIADFHQIIMEANFFKIEQNEGIKDLFVASTLPFDHYYIFRKKDAAPNNPGFPVRPQIAPWFTRGMENIRTMMKEGRRPEKPDYSDVFNTLQKPDGK